MTVRPSRSVKRSTPWASTRLRLRIGAREGPRRDRAVAVHQIAAVVPVRVRHRGPHGGESLGGQCGGHLVLHFFDVARPQALTPRGVAAPKGRVRAGVARSETIRSAPGRSGTPRVGYLGPSRDPFRDGPKEAVVQPLLMGAERNQNAVVDLRHPQDPPGWKAFDHLGRDNLAKLRQPLDHRITPS